MCYLPVYFFSIQFNQFRHAYISQVYHPYVFLHKLRDAARILSKASVPQLTPY